MKTRGSLPIAVLCLVAGAGGAGVSDAAGSADTPGNVSESKADPGSYCVYDIGRLSTLPAGETSREVTAINNRNQVVGWMTNSGGSSPLHAFIWDRRHGLRELGPLSGFPSTNAEDINDAGTVVGGSGNLATSQGVAFVWTKRRGIRQLDVSLGGAPGGPLGINSRGQIVGQAETVTGEFHAFFRDVKGDVIDIGVFQNGEFTSSAWAVNDRGRAVGIRGDGQTIQSFLWDERNGTRLIAENSGLAFVIAKDINRNSEVVGEMGGDPTRAFRWTQSGGLQDLGTLSGRAEDFGTATAINRWGTIVGASSTTAGPPHAFTLSRRSGMRDLNDLIDPSSALATAVLVIAQAINDAGWIAVDGFVPDPVDPARVFVLVPRRHPGNPPCD